MENTEPKTLEELTQALELGVYQDLFPTEEQYTDSQLIQFCQIITKKSFVNPTQILEFVSNYEGNHGKRGERMTYEGFVEALKYM